MSREASDPSLEFTGERFTPECVREIRYEHLHRYAWAAPRLAGLSVLDCAAGEGYGARLLADHAAEVVGVDISAEAVAHATRRYAGKRLEFACASALDLPFEGQRFDAVVSFETLEHLVEHDEMLTEFRRVLKPDGFLLLSSPDRKTYSDDTGFDNEFHVRELYRDELEALLARHFPNFRLFGQKLMFHSAAWALDGRVDGAECLTERAGLIERSGAPTRAPLYFLAVAAADGVALPEFDTLSLFDDETETVYAHYNDVVRKHIAAEQRLAECERELDRLRARPRGWRAWLSALAGRR